MSDLRERLQGIRTFPSLVKFLREELEWPIDSGSDFEDLTFEYTPEELGIDPASAAKIEEIKRLRPLDATQPWGIFFVKFEPKQLPVVALRRILNRVVVKKRATQSAAEQKKWATDDLLFISAYGEDQERRISFAHFSQDSSPTDLPTLKVLAWDDQDTGLHLDDVAERLVKHLSWPASADQWDDETWRERWGSAFELAPREVVTTSKALATRLAELAGTIRIRIGSVLEMESQDGPVTALMSAFREALVHDLTADDFADMYAQTIAYGLLSARVANPTGDASAEHLPLTNPFLKELMETFVQVGRRRGQGTIDFDELGVTDVVQLLDDANMEAVVRDFGDRNPQEDPVIHFYELFLKEYDAKKRIQRGVFYTPRPVVSYIVRSVDEILRNDFGLEDGLADTATWGDVAKPPGGPQIPDEVSPDQPFVSILDPATGTGTFLVEAIDVIHRTLVTKWTREDRDQDEILRLWNDYVPRYLLPRLHGFELLMAPYAIAHLKIGLKLHETGYQFESAERARVYLTNALEPADEGPDRFEFAVPALAHEAHAVQSIKRHGHFTVVIGNPPYAGISSNMSEDAQRIVDAYRVVDGKALKERKLWLQDDYVKFIRNGQTIIERSGAGVLGYITNHGYLDNPTFRGMRQSLLRTFGDLYVFDLHGNALKKERATDGSVDKNVFEIRQGVAICLGIARATDARSVHRADLRGSSDSKYNWLSGHSLTTTAWTELRAVSPFYFFHVATGTRDSYAEWEPLSQVMPVYSSGVITARDELVLDYGAEPILERVALLRDSGVTDEALRARLFRGKGSRKYAPGDSRGWKLPEARRKLREDIRWKERVAFCSYRPFDRRYVYLTEWMVDWSRPELRRHLELGDNPVLVFPRNTGAARPWDHAFVSYEPILGRFFPDSACITYMAPMLVMNSGGMFDGGCPARANFKGSEAREVSSEDDIRQDARQELGYIYALLYSPTYRRRYVSELRSDFPRIPPSCKGQLWSTLSGLGSELMDLHLMESPKLDASIASYEGPPSPEISDVRWSENVVWLSGRAKSGRAVESTGFGFHGVPETVWNFQIGGYQVCEKWLKARRGRALSRTDIEHYLRIVVALAETIRLMREIDVAIDMHGGWPGAFATDSVKAPA